jgi:hypothetical protein
VHHPLGNALVVEVEDLLPEMEVLQYTRSALAGPQGVLVLRDHDALLGRQPGRVPHRYLVNLAAGAALDPLIAILRPLVAGAGLFLARHEASSCLSVPRRGGWLPLEGAALPFAMAPTRNRED